MPIATASFDVLCFSHLRWDSVYQRPQHLLRRCAQAHRVFVVEEPVVDGGSARMEVQARGHNLWVAVPHLPEGLAEDEAIASQQDLVNDLLAA